MIYVFPAPAGINRTNGSQVPVIICVPRASGDKPDAVAQAIEANKCSPRQRG